MSDIPFKEKIKTIGLAPSATPSRRNNVPSRPAKESNSWERGIVKDDRGMPFLKDGKPIGVKDWANNRHKYEEARSRLKYNQQKSEEA